MGTPYYIGIGGVVGGPGDTWATRFDLPSSAIAAAAHSYGDSFIVGPGVYRELVSLDTPAGGYTYAVGTVSVTNESTAVVGAGTNWLAGPVAAEDQLFVGTFATAADGVTSGIDFTFTSVAAPFQANMVGYMIEIVTKGTYIIATFVAANSITLRDVNNLGFPAAGVAQTYYVVSGEGPYEVASVTDGTNLVLVKPWSGPTLTTMTYIIYRPMYLIGDVTGELTDGIGGTVRITGTDDDLVYDGVRTECIDGTARDYWMIRGFQFDCCEGIGIYLDTCDYITIEDCVFHDNDDGAIEIDESTQTTIRRCILTGGIINGIYIFGTVAPGIESCESLIANLWVQTNNDNIVIARSGGWTVKNVTFGWGCFTGISTSNQEVGTGVFVHHCQLCFQSSTVGGNAALDAAVRGQICSQQNNFFNNARNCLLVGPAVAGPTAQDTEYIYVPMLPLLRDNRRNPMEYWAVPSEWDPSRYVAGVYPANEDMFGIHSEIAQTLRSVGCIHAFPNTNDASPAASGFAYSLYMENAAVKTLTWPVQPNVTYSVIAQLNLETNYAGNVPDMVVRQPGQADIIVTSSGAKGSWEQLSTTITTGAEMDWLTVLLRSKNTATTSAYGVNWNDVHLE